MIFILNTEYSLLYIRIKPDIQSTKSRYYSRCDDKIDTRNFGSIQLDQTSEVIRDAPLDSNVSISKLKKTSSPVEHSKSNPKDRNSAKYSLNQSKRAKKLNNWASDKTRGKRKFIKKKSANPPKRWK
jgi:hypothetical protein